MSIDASDQNTWIREADASDAELMAVLGAVTFYEAYYEQDDPADLAGYVTQTFGVEKTASDLADPRSRYFIIFKGCAAVGYARLVRDSICEAIGSGKAVEIRRIYLVEREWGFGLGNLLMEHCLRAAVHEGFKTVWLSVWEKNPRAIRFYERHGFRRVGTLAFPYGQTVGTNLVMSLDLT